MNIVGYNTLQHTEHSDYYITHYSYIEYSSTVHVYMQLFLWMTDKAFWLIERLDNQGLANWRSTIFCDKVIFRCYVISWKWIVQYRTCKKFGGEKNWRIMNYLPRQYSQIHWKCIWHMHSPQKVEPWCSQTLFYLNM